MGKRVAIYARCSTLEQNVEMQLRDLREYVRLRDLVIVEEFVDTGISGTRAQRPALNALMSTARKHRFNIVLVWRFDRFARSTRHLLQSLAEFQSLGIDFISFQENIDTSSPLGEALFTILAAVSQLERDIIVSRVKAGLSNAKAKGKVLGRPKQRDDVQILALHTRGLSLREIAKQLGVSAGSVQRAVTASKSLKLSGTVTRG